jgi:hypothetical protein
MADSSINSFMSAFDGGSRPNLYSVTMTCPFGPLPQLQFLCKAATLPSSILGEVTVPYLGRVAKYPGDRQFEDWTIDILNDQGMSMRSVMETWNEMFNSYAGNTTPYANPRSIYGAATVAQLSRDYQVVKWYQFFDLWPDNIAPVQLGFDQNDQVSDFQCTFKYSYFVTSSSPFQVNGAAGVGGEHATSQCKLKPNQQARQRSFSPPSCGRFARCAARDCGRSSHHLSSSSEYCETHVQGAASSP